MDFIIHVHLHIPQLHNDSGVRAWRLFEPTNREPMDWQQLGSNCAEEDFDYVGMS